MADASKRTRKKIRCAIYTRKSSDDGLEQDFNSLDAQREACEAYIRSQKQEGWVTLPTFYDDGGLSGGSMKRPAPPDRLSERHHWASCGASYGNVGTILDGDGDVKIK